MSLWLTRSGGYEKIDDFYWYIRVMHKRWRYCFVGEGLACSLGNLSVDGGGISVRSIPGDFS